MRQQRCESQRPLGAAAPSSFLLLLALLFCLPATLHARGVALVMGNSAYTERPLPNAANDARDMAAVLREAGFTVLEHTNLDEAAMKEALADFEDRLRAAPGVGLFYFAGHGMQTMRGRNYLLPVGRTYRRERDVELFGVAADTVLARMEQVGNRLNIVILDACRDAPLPAEQRTVASRGLARMDAPSGSLIAFATAAGRTASDNPGRRNGLYTHHLLRALRTPGLRLEDVFKKVGREVERESGGLQSPEEFMKLRDPAPFCFFNGPGCGPGVRVQTAEEIEQETWDAIRNSRDPRDYREYLRRYPAGRFSLLADRQLRQLEHLPPSASFTQQLHRPPEALPMPSSAIQSEITSVTGSTLPAQEAARVTFSFYVLFDEHTGTPRLETREAFRGLASITGGAAWQAISVVGHASPDEGSVAQVQALSIQRAEAVKALLVSEGQIPRNRIYTEGKGAAAPVADNRTAEGRARNRRVELEVVGTRVRP